MLRSGFEISVRAPETRSKASFTLLLRWSARGSPSTPQDLGSSLQALVERIKAPRGKRKRERPIVDRLDGFDESVLWKLQVVDGRVGRWFVAVMLQVSASCLSIYILDVLNGGGCCSGKIDSFAYPTIGFIAMARVGRGNEYSWIAQQAIGRRMGDRSLHSVQENTSGFNRSLF